MNAEVNISDVVLETSRFLIRPWNKGDLEDFYEYAKVDGVGQMAGWEPHKSIEESRKILDVFLEGKNVFALELKESHKVIGSLGLEKLTIPLEERYDKLAGREIGYVLSKDYWGQGLMPEAVKRAIRYCFETEHYDFLLCCHSVMNKQSQRVIEKCGFQFLEEQNREAINGENRATRYYRMENPMLGR